MDVSRPLTAVIPTLDGPVLEALARTSGPLTGREVHRLVSSGSESGVRLVLTRLVEHGLVLARQAGQATLYVANREHVAWPTVESLTRLRQSLLDRIGALVDAWEVKPVSVAMFGSTARGDGDTHSDVDLLLVRTEDSRWEAQLGELRDKVVEWTGNPCQIYDLTRAEYAQHVRSGEPIVAEWRNDALLIRGTALSMLGGGL